MSVENAQKFLKKATEDESIQAEIKAAEKAYAGDKNDRVAAATAVILPIAAKAGLPFTVDDLKKAEETGRGAKLSDDELSKVAGGAQTNGTDWASCIGVGFGFGDGCTFVGESLCLVYGCDQY